MNSEREIVMKLREAKELEESSFEANGSTYKCVFGKYYKDNEQIDRDEYFKARDGQRGGSTPKSESPAKSEYPEDCEFEVRSVTYDDEGLHVKAYDKEYDEEFQQDWLPGRKTIESFLKDKAYGKTPEIIDQVKKLLGDEESKKPVKKDPYEDYKPEQFDKDMDEFEEEIQFIIDEFSEIHPEDREEYLGKLDDMDDKLRDMEEWLTDEQFERSEELRDLIRNAEDTEYKGPSIHQYDDPYASRGLRRSDFH